MSIININGRRFIRLDALETRGITHGFGTLDLGEDKETAEAAIVSILPGALAVASVKQVHGVNAVVVINAQEAEAAKEVQADVVIAAGKGVAATVRTADCVPILIADPERRVVAAVHAGWKGTVLGAAAEAVKIMVRDRGCRAGDMAAGIGPCIGPERYQVDGPVISGIMEAMGSASDRVLLPDPEPGKARLDLSLANRIVLERAGLEPSRVQETRLCTFDNPDLFFSYRRQGEGVPSLHHFIALV